MVAFSEFVALGRGFGFCWSEFGITTIWGVVGSGCGEANDFGAWWWQVCSGGVSDGFGSGLRRKGKELLVAKIHGCWWKKWWYHRKMGETKWGFGGGLTGFRWNFGDLPENN
ncbi:hypothetical protein KY284_007701 [Solanum tuberosum]|nr:hypothetical protein KY284_007701 [Solanum tuberosum]